MSCFFGRCEDSQIPANTKEGVRKNLADANTNQSKNQVRLMTALLYLS
jgi:hypothetical protein